MKVLIQGHTLAVATYDGQQLHVLNIQPSFTVEVDDVEATARDLNALFKSEYGSVLISTDEKFGDQEIKSLVREKLIPLIRNEDGILCTRCSIADHFYSVTGIPTIVDFMPIVGGRRGLEFNCFEKYRAVVIDGLGYVHAMCGASNTDIGSVVLSALDVIPDYQNGSRVFVEIGTGKLKAEQALAAYIKSVSYNKAVFSNNGHWFTY